MGASLSFFYGSMSSSKSLRLLVLAHSFDEKGIPILVLKPSADIRDGKNVIKSRVGLERECISVDSDVNIYEAVHELNNIRIANFNEPIRWILVDECQFLSEEQVDQLSDIVDYMSINVMCYGLRTDFKAKLFPASKRLFELADELEEIKSSCRCGERASINARFSPDGRIITEGSQILVGGDDLYKPLCRKDWKKLIKGA